ncbi:MAG: isoprenoid biosynthesis protein [Halothiobacillaceae bacterium]|nr:MAG: isoprenoid biosynthesis protein [Halothiobacillaceae bacterium]
MRNPLLARAFTKVLVALITCALSVLSPLTLAETPLLTQPFSASYVLKKRGFTIGRVERELNIGDNGLFIFTSVSRPAGIASLFLSDVIAEQSQWLKQDDNLQPQHYSYQRSGGALERHVELRFNWSTRMVTNVINKNPWKMAVPVDVKDKLLYQLSIMFDLAAGKQELNYTVADGGRLKTYQFARLPAETLMTALGELKTVKIARHLHDKTVTIWCASDLHYLPVQIEQNDEEGVYKLYIEAVKGL